MPNFKKLLDRKTIFIFIFILILIAGGLFFWWQENKNPYKYDVAENFLVDVVENQKILRNKQAGLVIEIPKDWKFSTTSASFLSPDAELFENGAIKNGSWIFIEIFNCSKFNPILWHKMECEETRKNIDEFSQNGFQDEKIDSFQVRKIDNLIAVEKREIHELDENREGAYLIIKVLNGNKLFYINGLLIPPTEERYNQLEELINGIRFY